MAASWITVVAPYLPEIVRLARPIFTRKPATLPDNSQAQRLDVVDEQITELQNAATQNADAIKLLATDMQKTIEVLQTASEKLEQRLHRAQQWMAVSLTLAAVAICIAVFCLVH